MYDSFFGIIKEELVSLFDAGSFFCGESEADSNLISG